MRIRAIIDKLTKGRLEDRVYFMFAILPCGEAGALQIPRWQGIAVAYYGCTLAALTPKPSDFFKIGVNL